ncbi:Mal d 1-associated protein [Rhynchospora pubera]|uniref:Mal d 1-associated protein n=1 Tax=Rhynchospora pubera TaxID=906938 RepID=A0AAV8DAV8_9POAL|nr:Mal d 1-associated protein [Rhynchospora pubera]
MAEEDCYSCVTRQVFRQRCAPEEVEPGRHVYRCEKTVQTLRDCMGRPTEVIESTTEITEHEMDGSWKGGMNFSIQQRQRQSSSSSPSWDRNTMPGFDDVIEGLERMTEGIMGEIGRITEGAERIGGLFGFPSIPGEEREARSHRGPSFPPKEEEGETDETNETLEPLYSEFADKVTDV